MAHKEVDCFSNFQLRTRKVADTMENEQWCGASLIMACSHVFEQQIFLVPELEWRQKDCDS